MKKLIVSGVALLLTAATLSAQTEVLSIRSDIKDLKSEEKTIKKEEKKEKKELKKLVGPQVSNLSKTNFYRDFGNITNVSWTRTAFFDKATFEQNGVEKTAYYDNESNLVGTTSPSTFAALPENAQKYISKTYQDYAVGDILFYDDNEFNETDMLLYGSEFADEDNYFVELQKGNEHIVIRVNPEGDVFFFKKLH